MNKLTKLIFNRIFWVSFALLLEILLVSGFIALLTTYYAEYSLYILIAYMVVIFLIDIYTINSRSNNAYKLTWMIIVSCLPFLGVTLYFLFANKRVTKRQLKKLQPIKDAFSRVQTGENVKDEIRHDHDALCIANYITNIAGTAMHKYTKTTYLASGEEAYSKMLEELKKAKHYIFMEYFIIAKGIMWGEIEKILIEKAASGVDVRVLYDDVGSASRIPVKYNRYLRSKGIKCYVFNRYLPFVNVKLNNRDHRKICVIDGHTGFTGGYNLADEYINETVRFGHWKDNGIMLQGDGVNSLTLMFLSIFIGVSGIPDDLNQYGARVYQNECDFEWTNDGYVQPYGDLPFDYDSVSEDVYLNIINRAEKYIYIVTPYLIIDEETTRALVNASRQNVSITILTPGIPDKKLVYGVSRSYYKPLLDVGIKIYEYTPGFVHEKMVISDDKFATCGTANFDYRSLYFHLENGVFLYKCSCIKEMKEDFENSINISEEVTIEKYNKKSKHKKLLWALLKVISPML